MGKKGLSVEKRARHKQSRSSLGGALSSHLMNFITPVKRHRALLVKSLLALQYFYILIWSLSNQSLPFVVLGSTKVYTEVFQEVGKSGTSDGQVLALRLLLSNAERACSQLAARV